MSAPTDRATTIARFITAAAVCVVTAVVSKSIIDGYVQAIHHQLQPNSTVGFRDSTTRSCLPAWYAAQKAGFSWLLFGGGPVLGLNILFCVFAALRRRAPWEVLAMSVWTVVLLGIVVVGAGIHADGTARAIAC